jgi:hypothetical protein
MMYCRPDQLRNGGDSLYDELRRAGWARKDLEDLLYYQDQALALLEELRELGFAYKRLDHYHFCPFPGGASWEGCGEVTGHITLHRGCEPAAVAHELGHGFHERLRKDRQLPDDFGEDYAEAVRWFTEQRARPTQWFHGFKTSGKPDQVLRACDYDWDVFKERLIAGLYYPAT